MKTWKDYADWENEHHPAFAEGYACPPGSPILIEDENGEQKVIPFDPETLLLDTKVIDWHYKELYKTSDTSLEAEWVKDKVFRIYHCSNCNDAHGIEKTTKLHPYCRQCGAKMKNPQWITVEYDWD